MSPHDRRELVNRAVWLQRQMVWLGRRLFDSRLAATPVQEAMRAELEAISRQLAADQAAPVIPFRRSA